MQSFIVGAARFRARPSSPADRPDPYRRVVEPKRSRASRALQAGHRRAIDKSDWDAAAKAFGERRAAEGRARRRGALLAGYALYKSGQPDQALKSLATLKAGYPQSRWQRDRRALELEIRQATGQTPQVEADDSDELKLMALSGLMNADPHARCR